MAKRKTAAARKPASKKSAPKKPAAPVLHALYDEDAQTLVQVFEDGSNAERKEAAETLMSRQLGNVGEGQSRNLSVVKLVRA